MGKKRRYLKMLVLNMISFFGKSIDRFWTWLTTLIICIGWPFYMQFLYLPLLWAQILLVQNFSLWLLMLQKIGNAGAIWSLIWKFIYLNSLICIMRLKIALHRVPNIKFNVAKVLQSLIPIVDQSVSKFILILIIVMW